MSPPKKPRLGTGTSEEPAGPGPPVDPRPWTLRFAKRILAEDLPAIGHAAFEVARKAIQKKLPVDPLPYVDGLRPPLGGIYKLKSSHVRVAYHVEEAAHEVWVLMIADRNAIWDRHEDKILGRLEVMREERAGRGGAEGRRP